MIASVDPQFSIVTTSVLPVNLSTDRYLANVVKTVVPVQLPNGRPYGTLVGLSRDLPRPMTNQAEAVIPLLANMLGALAGAEATVAAAYASAERSDAALDGLTGTATRQAWDITAHHQRRALQHERRASLGVRDLAR